MPYTSPDQLYRDMQAGGVLMVKNSTLYFFSVEELEKCKLPDAFQSGAQGLSDDYFRMEPNQPGGMPDGVNVNTAVVNSLIMSVLALDGVDQAISLEEAASESGKVVSKASRSGKTIFVYTPDKKKIVVDSVRGGRPSQR